MLNIIKRNKKIQNKLDISLEDYKVYSIIKIEIKMCKNEEFYDIVEKFYEFIEKLNYKSNFLYEIIIGKNTITKNTVLKINENEIKDLIDQSLSFQLNIITNSKFKSLSQLFYECSFIKEIKFKNFINDRIIDMKFMFYKCSNLTTLELSSFNTSNVTNMSYMFSECSSLINLNLENFNTSNVTNMSGMFCGCTLLKELNINNFNTNEETYMYLMFDGCKNLKSIIKPNDTSKAEDLINLINTTLKLKK